MKSLLAALLAVASLALSVETGLFAQCSADAFVKPPFLKCGDTVAVVASSYQPTDSSIARSCRVLKSWGFVPVVAKNITDNPLPRKKDTVRYYSGDAAQRAESLVAAYEDESVKAIICARGGYGAIHLLDLIPQETYRKHPKWLVGYSDVTTLHCASFKAGVMSIHGEMCNSFGGLNAPDEGALKLRDLLKGDIPVYEISPTEYNSNGLAHGVLIGGNMITMAALAGTGYDPSTSDGIILFFEEVEESMHAIDRLFNMLVLQGHLSNVRGIIFGDFEDCDRDLPYESVEEMLSVYTKKLGIPVCFGFPAGHGKVNMPLVEGAMTVLDVSDGRVGISFLL